MPVCLLPPDLDIAEATSACSCCVQELLALPAITPTILQKFEADVAATGSEKEQRFIIRKLLMQSGMHMPFNMCLAWEELTLFVCDPSCGRPEDHVHV